MSTVLVNAATQEFAISRHDAGGEEGQTNGFNENTMQST